MISEEKYNELVSKKMPGQCCRMVKWMPYDSIKLRIDKYVKDGQTSLPDEDQLKDGFAFPPCDLTKEDEGYPCVYLRKDGKCANYDNKHEVCEKYPNRRHLETLVGCKFYFDELGNRKGECDSCFSK